MNSENNTLIVIGIASKNINREIEIENAKNDAALKIAMFYGMRGITESIRKDSNLDSWIIIENSIEHMGFIEQLQFDRKYDVLFNETETLVRFKYQLKNILITPVSKKYLTRHPEWLNSRHLPNIEGYTLAVGFAQNRGWLRDTVMRSAKDAAMRMIEQGKTILIEKNIETEFGTEIETHTKSEGFLSYFRILEFWIDPKYKHVHTLGIARFRE